jgi:hypothetical protein
MEAKKEEDGLFRMLLETFRALPTWEKVAVVVTCVLIAPAMAFFGVWIALALFPLVFFGRFEGDLGEAPVAREINRRVRRQHARTERYYAT